MRYIEGVPPTFHSAAEKKFLQWHGDKVWEELCDVCPIGQPIRVSHVAKQLTSLQKYSQPERYLAAVLKHVEADYRSRPGDYEHKPPFQRTSDRLLDIVL